MTDAQLPVLADLEPAATRPAPSVRIASWRDGTLTEQEDHEGVVPQLKASDGFTWVDLTEPAPELVERIAREIGLHALVAEDIIERNERAKVEPVGDYVHLVMFALTRDGETRTHEVDFVLGKRFLLSVHPAAWDPRSAHQLKLGLDAVLQRGPDFLLWALVDAVVDGYFPIFDAFGDEIDELQDSVVDSADRATVQQLFAVKRELIRIRHVIGPSREIFAQLTGREFEVIGDSTVFYFRDVYDHLIRLTDEFEAYREQVTSALELYLSTVNNNLSVIMKRLTGVTVVLAGLGAVAGIFGMSEAASAVTGGEGWGFYFVTLASVALAALGIWLLRRIGWL
ncbi:MAG TPA: magnesium transporter CorA family protein [Candidatus Limnocylindria bacterium]